MATSDISICSNALLMLGDKPISSFDEGDSPTNIMRAQLCGNLFPVVRDSVLRARAPNCAKKRALLAPLADAPAWGWNAQFQKPSDWLRTIQIGYDMESWTYRDEGGVILCDSSTLPMLYVFRSEAYESWDAMLVDLMTHAMALRLAWPITKSTTQVEVQQKLYRDVWLRSGAVDGQDDGPEDLGSFDMLSARLMGSIT